MPVTARQKQLVQQSFDKVLPLSEKASDIFYQRLFEYSPEVKKLFRGDMQAQGKMLMATLKLAVNGLNDLDKLVPVLHKLALRHINYGVRAEDYTPVGNALLYALKQGLGDDFNNEVRDAWVSVYRAIAKTMKKKAYGIGVA